MISREVSLRCLKDVNVLFRKEAQNVFSTLLKGSQMKGKKMTTKDSLS